MEIDKTQAEALALEVSRMLMTRLENNKSKDEKTLDTAAAGLAMAIGCMLGGRCLKSAVNDDENFQNAVLELVKIINDEAHAVATGTARLIDEKRRGEQWRSTSDD
jgi:hypothetical protein